MGRASKRKKEKRERQIRLEGEIEQIAPDAKPMPSPPGGIKMSEVLLDFLRPWLAQIEPESKQEYENLLMMGVFAWNAGMLPEEEQDWILDDFLDLCMPEEGEELDEEVYGVLLLMLDEMMERRQQEFSEYEFSIVNFYLETDSDGDYQLVVASRPMENPERPAPDALFRI